MVLRKGRFEKACISQQASNKLLTSSPKMGIKLNFFIKKVYPTEIFNDKTDKFADQTENMEIVTLTTFRPV